MNETEGPFLLHGGYRKLRSYKVAEAVYDATVVFCRRFLAHDRRLTDQMVQAARSGVRNISEGSQKGGFTESLYAARTQVRTAQAQPAPACPSCGRPMVQRSANTGSKAGQRFWGCSGYPGCKGTRPI